MRVYAVLVTNGRTGEVREVSVTSTVAVAAQEAAVLFAFRTWGWHSASAPTPCGAIPEPRDGFSYGQSFYAATVLTP